MLYRILRLINKYFVKPIYNLTQYRIVNKRIVDLYQNNYETLKSLIDIRALIPATGELRLLQLQDLSFAHEIMDICTSINVTPFMFAGTLLGAERHGGFIPWDDDFDFAMIRNDYQILRKYGKENFIYKILPKDRLYIHYHNLQFIDNLLKEYPNKIIFLQLVDAIHILKGSSIQDYVKVDIFPLDFYSDDYLYSDHIKYLNKLQKKLIKINNFEKELAYLDKERYLNKNIVEHSNTISYGIDNPGSYIPSQRTGWWTHDDFFPLKKMQFENTEFFAPNNHIKILDYWCKNWREFPNELTPKLRKDYK